MKKNIRILFLTFIILISACSQKKYSYIFKNYSGSNMTKTAIKQESIKIQKLMKIVLDSNLSKRDSSFRFLIFRFADEREELVSLQQNGVYTRRYLGNNYYRRIYSSVLFEFNDKELNDIQTQYFKQKLDTLPKNYTCRCVIPEFPVYDAQIVVYYKGRKQTLLYERNLSCIDTNKKGVYDNISSFYSLIMNAVLKKDQVKGMKNCDWEVVD